MDSFFFFCFHGKVCFFYPTDVLSICRQELHVDQSQPEVRRLLGEEEKRVEEMQFKDGEKVEEVGGNLRMMVDKGGREGRSEEGPVKNKEMVSAQMKTYGKYIFTLSSKSIKNQVRRKKARARQAMEEKLATAMVNSFINTVMINLLLAVTNYD